MNFEEIGILGFFLGLAVWYVKYKIESSSNAQLDRILELEKNKNRELLESLKADLGLQADLLKAKHLSIYERKVHALLDTFACISDCEAPMGRISEDCVTNQGKNFLKLHEEFIDKKEVLTNTFWRNSALFPDSLIQSFQAFKRGSLMPYSLVYKTIRESAESTMKVADHHVNKLSDLEIEYGKFASELKNEIKSVLNQS